MQSSFVFNRFIVVLLLVCSVLFTLFTKAQRVTPIRIDAANARLYRDTLNFKVFGTTVFPYNLLPDSVVTGVTSIDHLSGFPYAALYGAAGNLQRIDKMVVKLDGNSSNFPASAKVYLFRPQNTNGKLFIYHAGHCAGSAPVEDIVANGGATGVVIPALLQQGYTVLAVPMLYYQQSIPNDYVCGFNGHDELFQDSLYAHPMAFFFKPLIASLNQLGRSNYSAIYMMGLSGGGWATSLYPAMDSSVRVSVPVAGSWPMALRAYFYGDGDREQYFPPIFGGWLDYHDLYTLSCLAPARKMLQINNRYDACCFNGADRHIFYVDSVAKALEGTGGNFKFYLDETINQHAVSARAMEVITAFINGDEAQLQPPPPDSVYAGMLYNYNVRNNFTVNGNAATGLRYSLLKAPEWLSMNPLTGVLSGQVLPGAIIPITDSASFKVEDDQGRFVVYNINFIKKRTAPFLFTMAPDSSTLYLLPFYSGSITTVSPLSASSFFFNNPALEVTNLAVLNGSVLQLRLNQPLQSTDSIGYNGFASANPVRYANGLRMEDFSLKRILFNAVNNNYARAGMIRFNSDTRKFEYFNGTGWVNMH